MTQQNYVTGKKYRVMLDKAKKIWNVLSFWTHAKDVEFDSGYRLQDTCGDIYGISCDYSLRDCHIAASTDLINGKVPFRFGIDSQDRYGYYKKVNGADTFFPFSGSAIKYVSVKDYDGYKIVSKLYDASFIEETYKSSEGVSGSDGVTVAIKYPGVINIFFSGGATGAYTGTNAYAVLKLNGMELGQLGVSDMYTTTEPDVRRGGVAYKLISDISVKEGDTVSLTLYSTNLAASDSILMIL